MCSLRKFRYLVVTVLMTILATLPLAQSGAGGLTAAHSYQDNSEIGIWAREFMNCLGDRVDIYVELIGAGELGSTSELVQAVQSHEVDVAVLSVASIIEHRAYIASSRLIDGPGCREQS